MTDQKLNELSRWIREQTEEVKQHPEKAVPLLQRIGLLDEQGKVRPEAEEVARLLWAEGNTKR